MMEQKKFVRSYVFLLDPMINDRPYELPCEGLAMTKFVVVLFFFPLFEFHYLVFYLSIYFAFKYVLLLVLSRD